MKIMIKVSGKMGIRLWLPSRMVFSNTTARLMARSADDEEKESKEARVIRKRKAIRDRIKADTGLEGLGDRIRQEVHGSLEKGLEDLPDKEKDLARPAFDLGDLFSKLPADKAREAMRVLRKMKKTHPGVPLVDVVTADGDRVLIKP